MPIRVSLNVSLTPELEQFAESRVASGRYQTASEVIREGLRLLEEREQTREVALEELRAQLRRGVEQADSSTWRRDSPRRRIRRAVTLPYEPAR
jgi:antitoxin ParD1/3/4